MPAVTEVQSAALAYADSAIGTMNSFLASLGSIPNLDPGASFQRNARYDILWNTLPSAAGLTVSFSPITTSGPEAPTIGTITVPDLGAFPELSLADPVLSLPVAPGSSLPAAPTGAPEFNAPATPAKPTFTLPSAPTLASLTLPEKPAISLPTFDADVPFDDVVAPTAEFDFAEERYRSALMDEATAKLLADLQNGGYGIEPADEEALWERARERELKNTAQALDELASQAASRGFAVPPGVLSQQSEAVRLAGIEKSSSISREIALKRADLFVQNRQFTFQQAQAFEGLLIGYYSSYAERALNAARAVVDAGVAIFNARVQRLNLQIELYRARASVFETQLRAALSHLEVFKAEVEAAKLSQEAQQANVALYTAQLEGVNTLAAIYRTEVEAARSVASIEALRLDAFKTRVETYTAQVAAKNAEFEIYKTQISGEVAKVQAFSAVVDAYKAKASAYASRVQAADISTRSQIAIQELSLDRYRAQLSGYSADLDRQFKNLSAQVDIFRANVQKFSAESVQITAANGQAVDAAKADADVAISNTRNAIAEAQVRASAAEATARLGVAAAEGGARVNASVVASALSAASGLAAEIVETTA